MRVNTHIGNQIIALFAIFISFSRLKEKRKIGNENKFIFPTTLKINVRMSDMGI